MEAASNDAQALGANGNSPPTGRPPLMNALLSGSTDDKKQALILALESLSEMAKELAQVARERGSQWATILAKKSAQLARAAGVAAKRLAAEAQVASASGAVSFRQTSGVALRRALHALEHSEAFQLRPAHGMPGRGGWALPDVVLALLAARIVWAANGVLDVVCEELLHTRTLMARLGLLLTASPGCLLSYYFRAPLLRDIDWTSSRHSQLEQLVYNSRCLPPVFWVSLSCSGLLAVRVGQEIGYGVVRTAVRGRFLSYLRTILLVLLVRAFAASPLRDQMARALEEQIERLPPSLAAAMTTARYNVQVATRWGCERGREAFIGARSVATAVASNAAVHAERATRAAAKALESATKDGTPNGSPASRENEIELTVAPRVPNGGGSVAAEGVVIEHGNDEGLSSAEVDAGLVPRAAASDAHGPVFQGER